MSNQSAQRRRRWPVLAAVAIAAAVTAIAVWSALRRPAPTAVRNISFTVVAAAPAVGDQTYELPDGSLVYGPATPGLTVRDARLTLISTAPPNVPGWVRAVDRFITVVPLLPPGGPPDAVRIETSEADSRRMSVFTGGLTGDRILVQIGGRPLVAPQMTGPIAGHAVIQCGSREIAARVFDGSL